MIWSNNIGFGITCFKIFCPFFARRNSPRARAIISLNRINILYSKGVKFGYSIRGKFNKRSPFVINISRFRFFGFVSKFFYCFVRGFVSAFVNFCNIGFGVSHCRNTKLCIQYINFFIYKGLCLFTLIRSYIVRTLIYLLPNPNSTNSIHNKKKELLFFFFVNKLQIIPQSIQRSKGDCRYAVALALTTVNNTDNNIYIFVENHPYIFACLVILLSILTS